MAVRKVVMEVRKVVITFANVKIKHNLFMIEVVRKVVIMLVVRKAVMDEVMAVRKVVIMVKRVVIMVSVVQSLFMVGLMVMVKRLVMVVKRLVITGGRKHTIVTHTMLSFLIFVVIQPTLLHKKSYLTLLYQ